MKRKIFFTSICFSFLVISYSFFGCGKKTETPTTPSWQEKEDWFWGDYPELGEGSVCLYYSSYRS